MPPVVTVAAAAAHLGYKSRATLYAFLKAGRLAPYVAPPVTPGGAAQLDLAPDGVPSLREYLGREAMAKVSGKGERRPRPRAQQTAAEACWAAVGRSLTESLSAIAGPIITGPQARLLAAALPAALAAAWGAGGLEQHRRRLVLAGCWRAGWAVSACDVDRWQAVFGPDDWRPGEPLEAGSPEWWDAVAGSLEVADGAGGGSLPLLSGERARAIASALAAAMEAVDYGARWSAQEAAEFEAQFGDLFAAPTTNPAAAEGEAVDKAELLETTWELRRLIDGGALSSERTREAIAVLAAIRARLED